MLTVESLQEAFDRLERSGESLRDTLERQGWNMPEDGKAFDDAFAVSAHVAAGVALANEVYDADPVSASEALAEHSAAMDSEPGSIPDYAKKKLGLSDEDADRLDFWIEELFGRSPDVLYGLALVGAVIANRSGEVAAA